jgi:hypothetical protein
MSFMSFDFLEEMNRMRRELPTDRNYFSRHSHRPSVANFQIGLRKFTHTRIGSSTYILTA